MTICATKGAGTMMLDASQRYTALLSSDAATNRSTFLDCRKTANEKINYGNFHIVTSELHKT